MAATAARSVFTAPSSSSDAWPTVRVPAAAGSLEGFREWAKSDDFPQRGSVTFIHGEILIDMSPEELETHIKVKTEIASVLHRLCRDSNLGTYYADGVLLANADADLSTEPDGTFAGWECIRSGRMRRVPRKGRPGEFIELEGTPDWVMEVISRSSIRKDTQEMRQAYHRAGIPEYWLINALGKQLDFQILNFRATGYVAAGNRQGWRRSRIFQRDFRLRRQRDELGDWQYSLEFKSPVE